MINGHFTPIFVWKNTVIRFIEEDVIIAVYNYYCLRVVCMKSEYLITQSWLCLLRRILATKSYANPSTKLAVRQNFPSKSKSRAPHRIYSGIFHMRKLLLFGRKMEFVEKTFVDCSLVPRPSLQTITKIITDRRKTAKFGKVFSLESFPLYSTMYM